MADMTIANLFYDVPDRENRVGYVPIGPLYVASALEKAGYEVEFRDYLVASAAYPDPLSAASVCSFLEDSADIIGIGCASELLPLTILSVQELKRRQPHKTVILGGIGPAGAAEEILTRFPFVDMVVRGEGEATMTEVLARLRQRREPAGVAGLSYRRGERVTANPDRPRIDSLDDLPFPAYQRVKLEHYAHLGIYSGRGCPYACTFCDVAPFWLRRNVARSVDNLVEEIGLLMQTVKQGTFDIMDDIFVLDRQRVLDFCEALRAKNLEVEWACCGRIDLMDEELMARMADSGCTWIFYGIESGSDRVLKKIRKGFSREEARDIIIRSGRYFQVVTSLMWGFPFETLRDFDDTADFISFMKDRECGVDLYLLAPLPFSPLYEAYRRDLELVPEKCRRLFGAGDRQMLDFIRDYPGVSQWFYRYPTPHFRQKSDRVRELGYWRETV
jgi:anaerobic magnesium-protoporphyrin IX monomethyl ester cyclase